MLTAVPNRLEREAIEREGKIIGWRRRRLPNGRYLQIAIVDTPGPRGGHTLAYMLTRKKGAEPEREPTPDPPRRRVIVKRKGGNQA